MKEEIYRGIFGTSYMFKADEIKIGPNKITVKAGIPNVENF